MKRTPFKISDHAAMGFLQRVKGIDIAAVKAEVAEQVATDMPLEGEAAVTRNGFRYVIQNGVVVTVKKITSRKTRRFKGRPE